MVIELPTEKNSEKIAQQLATYLKPPLLLTFSGEIGSGKTTFIRAMLRSLGVDSAIKSPTFSLVESYERPQFFIHHFDLYRIVDPMELEEMGFREYFEENAVCCIEWPEQAGPHPLPVDIAFSMAVNGLGRTMRIQALSAAGCAVLSLFEGDK